MAMFLTTSSHDSVTLGRDVLQNFESHHMECSYAAELQFRFYGVTYDAGLLIFP